MKKIFTLIIASFIVLSAVAQPNEAFRKQYNYKGKLSVSSMMNVPVKIMIDGNMSQDMNNETMPTDVKVGYHSVKVYQQKKKNNNGWKTNKGMQLVYEGNVYVKAQYHVDISINRFGKAFIDEKQMSGGYFDEYDNDWNNDEWSNAVQPMNGRSFDQFKQVIRNESFDNTKLVVAKQTISANNLSTAQVKEIVQLFSFENSKLDIAKYSYKYTLDKNNYFMLNDAFSFSSSKEELARYIQAYR